MNVILERKAPYIKPYKGYNQYNNRRLNISLYPTIPPIINVYIRSTGIISFIMWKRSGGGNIALIWRKKRN